MTKFKNVFFKNQTVHGRPQNFSQDSFHFCPLSLLRSTTNAKHSTFRPGCYFCMANTCFATKTCPTRFITAVLMVSTPVHSFKPSFVASQQTNICKQTCANKYVQINICKQTCATKHVQSNMSKPTCANKRVQTNLGKQT